MPVKKLTEVQILALEPTELLREKLREVRKSRAAAEKKAAYTAVSTMHRLEFDISKALAIRASNGMANPMATLSDEELIEMVVSTIAELPPEAVAKAEAALKARKQPSLRVVGS